MKFILPLTIALTASAWAMETKGEKEKEPQLFPIGSLTLNVDEKSFSGEKIDEIGYYAGEIGAIYTRRFYEIQEETIVLEKKLSTILDLQNTDKHTHHYYTSKIEYLKNKLARKKKLKNAFSALPQIFNQVLLLTLKNPTNLGACIASSPEPNTLLYYTLYENATITSSAIFPRLENQHQLLRQLNLAEITYSSKDRSTWDKIMQICQEHDYDKEDSRDLLNPHHEELYSLIHYVKKDMKRYLPEKALEALGPLKAYRREVVEKMTTFAETESPLAETMNGLLKTMNDVIGTFKKDVEELYKQLPENSQLPENN